MNRNRFGLIDIVKAGTHSGIWDSQKPNNQRIGDELWLGEVVEMLNEGVIIAKENEQLKQKNGDLISMISRVQYRADSIKRENKQLKEDRNELFIRERDVKNDWRELKYENVQLKEEIKDLNDILARYEEKELEE